MACGCCSAENIGAGHPHARPTRHNDSEANKGSPVRCETPRDCAHPGSGVEFRNGAAMSLPLPGPPRRLHFDHPARSRTHRPPLPPLSLLCPLANRVGEFLGTVVSRRTRERSVEDGPAARPRAHVHIKVRGRLTAAWQPTPLPGSPHLLPRRPPICISPPSLAHWTLGHTPGARAPAKLRREAVTHVVSCSGVVVRKGRWIRAETGTAESAGMACMTPEGWTKG